MRLGTTDDLKGGIECSFESKMPGESKEMMCHY